MNHVITYPNPKTNRDNNRTLMYYRDLHTFCASTFPTQIGNSRNRKFTVNFARWANNSKIHKQNLGNNPLPNYI